MPIFFKKKFFSVYLTNDQMFKKQIHEFFNNKFFYEKIEGKN